MSSIGRISLDLNVNNRQFNRQVDGIQRQTTRAFGSMSVAVGNVMANMAAKAAASIGNFVKDSINKGSELTELENVVESVFTTMSNKVDAFAKSALDTYGLTEKQAKKMVGTFGAMSKSFGYSEEQSYAMSTALAGLAGDVASFYNLGIDEAYAKMKSVYTGETESLKELGVVMTQTALDEFALANGFGKTTNKMTEQEKVALRLAFVQDKLADASGDVIRTQDSWANQTRKLSGQLDTFKTAIGQGLINVLTPVIKVINTIMAKLIQLAYAFRSFTEMVMGKSSGGGVGSAMNEVADAAENAANSTGGIENAANGAAEAAKKAQKSLMGFDEINKLQSNSDTSSGGGGGASFDNIDFGGAIAQQEQVAANAINKLNSEVHELITSFKEGFKEGLGHDFENSILRTKSHIKEIGNSLKQLFKDPAIVKSAKTMTNKVSNAIGKVLGSIASVGASISEMLFGGLEQYLSQNSGFIKDRLVGIFDVTGEYLEIAGNLGKAVASVFEVLRGDSASNITANLIGIIENAYLSVVQLSIQIGRDIINCIAQPIIENQDKIKLALENTFAPLGEILATLNESVKVTFEKIFEVYNAYVRPAFEGIARGISLFVSALLDAYNTYIAPVLDSLSAKFTEVWESHVQPLINKGIVLIGKVCELISFLWETILAPLISWIATYVIATIAPVIETIGKLVMTLFGTISDIVSGIFDVLGGLIDFIMGVFTGDWSRAWEGIKGIFSGAWDIMKSTVSLVWEAIKGVIDVAITSISSKISVGLEAATSVVTTCFEVMKTAFSTALTSIKNVVQSAFNGIWDFMKGIINTMLGGIELLVNGVINGLNKMVGAMNNLSFDVPDWVPEIGGKKFGFSIPTLQTVNLPRLAEGGYIRANQPQPVIVGDNKTQGEIVSPENKMLEVMIQALEQFFGQLLSSGYNTTGNGEVGDIIIPIYLDGTILDEVIVTAQQRRNLRSGGR